MGDFTKDKTDSLCYTMSTRGYKKMSIWPGEQAKGGVLSITTEAYWIPAKWFWPIWIFAFLFWLCHFPASLCFYAIKCCFCCCKGAEDEL